MLKNILKKMIFFKRFAVIFLILVVIAVVGNFLFGEKGFTEQRSLSRQIKELEFKIDSLSQELKTKKEIQERLQKDTLYIETIARTRFGMSRKEETVYYFVPEKP